MQLPTISFENILRQKCPAVRLGLLLSEVKVGPSSESLQQQIEETLAKKSSQLEVTDIAQLPPLADTRQAYKNLGKDPSRYRPSAEALTRRVVKGKGLYQVNNVVDALNWVSVMTGFSIGGYDFSKINGTIISGHGEENEPYEAIGRGELNIAGLPVLRDESGAFGSPTSDSTRTMVTETTTHFLAVIFDFGGNNELEKAVSSLEAKLNEHANGKTIASSCLKP